MLAQQLEMPRVDATDACGLMEHIQALSETELGVVLEADSDAASLTRIAASVLGYDACRLANLQQSFGHTIYQQGQEGAVPFPKFRALELERGIIVEGNPASTAPKRLSVFRVLWGDVMVMAARAKSETGMGYYGFDVGRHDGVAIDVNETFVESQVATAILAKGDHVALLTGGVGRVGFGFKLRSRWASFRRRDYDATR